MADPAAYDDIFEQAGRDNNVDPALLKAIAKQESGFNPKAVGPMTKSGRAHGMMQIIPSTAASLGVTDAFDPKQAIPGAARLLAQYLDQYGNVDDAVSAYHGGTDQKQWGQKTQAYHDAVTANYTGQAPAGGGGGTNLLSMAAGTSPAAAGGGSAGAPSGGTNLLALAAGGGSGTPDAPATAPVAQGAAAPKKSNVLGFEQGFTKGLDNLATAAETIPGVKAVSDAISHLTGMPTVEQANQSHKDAIAAAAQKGVVPSGLGRIAGNIAVTAPLSRIPGVGPIVAGAGAGAMLTDEKTPGGVIKDAALGAAGGKLGDMGTKLVSKVIQPVVAPAVKKLIGEGVYLTPGRIAGGALKDAEDKLTSLPIVGDMIKRAQGRSIETFNRAAINRALTPAGMSLPDHIPVGRDAVSYAGDQLSAAYDKVLPTLKVKIDPTFTKNVTSLTQLAKNLPPDQAKIYNRLLKSEVLSGFAPKTGQMSGETMKTVESVLGSKIRNFQSSASPHDRDLADALRELQSEVRGLVVRNNPDKAPLLKGINTGWANLVRIERAAAGNGAKDGVFTPAQLGAAVKAADSSVRKRVVAKGGALMQDLSDAAQKVIPSKIPDSGTAGRSLFNLLVGGGIPAAAVALHANPVGVIAGAAGTGAAMLPYTKVGGKLVQAAMTSRPAVAAPVANVVSKLKTPAALAGAALVTGGSKKKPQAAASR